ncbi:MAG: Ig-like domain-containing protein, partial [Sutterellaceae bacterium]|nr:Ig-like domain-containing protein [Burkholderiaceae bacterium]MDW8430623.1 Ig-like domain-containing protein [Sutterellaceae bacterium]
MQIRYTLRLGTAAVLSLLASAALAAGVSVKFDLSTPDGAPFPSDRFTVPDFSQRTLRRVNLPKPDCTVRPSDCADIDVLNTLDGFNTQPRITVPFTGPIDPATVNSNTIYLVNLGDTLTLRGFGERVGINQVIWDPATNTLAFESDQLLAEHSRYLLVITNGVRDAAGNPIAPGRFGRFRHDLNFGQTHDQGLKAYRKDLLDGMHSAGVPRERIVALSLFTTRSSTGFLDKVRRQIKAATPAPVNFMIGNNGTERAYFPLPSITAIQFNRQIGTAPTFASSFLPTPALNVVPGAVGAIAYGRFSSPNFQNAARVIPPTPTLLGRPQPQGTHDLTVQLFLPAGAKPAGGWPVAIFGHGFTDSMYGAPWVVASVFAAHGIATASINVVGHGGGPLGTLTVLRPAAAPVVVPAGGRGIDQDGNGTIDATEGVNAAAPYSIVGSS